jgi:alginate O-acetyltransferase complex protein AlgI
MVFSSLEFLLAFLPITLILYFIVPLRWRNAVLLAVSLVFYGWGEPVYVFLMCATIAIDYAAGFVVDRYKKRGDMRSAKAAMIVSIALNLAVLAFFKYWDFIAEALRVVPFLSGLPTLGLGLPIGISFYTFQSLSYVIDVYRGDGAVQKNLAAFGAYVTLFPQLIAGPIVRYRDVDDQLRSREHSTALFASGIRTFTAGLAKKVLIANQAGALWSAYAAVPTDSRTVLGAWFGIICYTMQIYFDFSGYSDMAIGLGKMFGFRFLENFNYPYIARSVTDFWRRWHISLSSWFREYVYIPLGGSRNDRRWKTYRNLLVVWFLTGLWHGANWNFILWGLYYFVILAAEKAFMLKALERAPRFVGHIYSLVIILFGWLIFVFDGSGAGLSFSDGVAYLGNMFGAGVTGFADATSVYDALRNLPFLAVAALACTPLPKRAFYALWEKRGRFRPVSAVLCILLFLVCIAYLVASKFNPFLYYRF